MGKTKVITISNQKGGVGKTNMTVNLGIGLARLGKKILICDADPQSDLTTSLGWRNQDQLSVTLTTLMQRAINDKPIKAGEAILHHPEQVDLIPADLDLSAMEMTLVTAMSREYVLKNCLKEIKADYDFILLDTMPSLGMITINALAAADSVIIPVQAHYLSTKGMTQLIKTINKIKRQINKGLKIDGAVLTMVDIRTNMTKTVAETLYKDYGKDMNIYRNAIPMAIKAAETSVVGQSIYTYDKGSKVAEAYMALSKEVLKDGEKQRAQIRSSQCR